MNRETEPLTWQIQVCENKRKREAIFEEKAPILPWKAIIICEEKEEEEEKNQKILAQ